MCIVVCLISLLGKELYLFILACKFVSWFQTSAVIKNNMVHASFCIPVNRSLIKFLDTELLAKDININLYAFMGCQIFLSQVPLAAVMNLPQMCSGSKQRNIFCLLVWRSEAPESRY